MSRCGKRKSASIISAMPSSASISATRSMSKACGNTASPARSPAATITPTIPRICAASSCRRSPSSRMRRQALRSTAISRRSIRSISATASCPMSARWSTRPSASSIARPFMVSRISIMAASTSRWWVTKSAMNSTTAGRSARTPVTATSTSTRPDPMRAAGPMRTLMASRSSMPPPTTIC
ncbi:hypothetical protein D3C78_1118490 [compost metagenome]